MNKVIIGKLTKYLFYISILLSVISLAHLIYIYLYKDYKEKPIKGGTISEAIIGDFPHFNPLVPSTNHNKYINHLLYRSLLRYDIEKQEIVSDLASCDTSNLLYIECYLENNIKWSSGEDITTKDIVSTLNLLKESNTNPIMSSLLANVTIEEKEGMVTFSNTKKDINFLNLFFQPIMPEKVINNLSIEEINGKISYINGIYSGRYKISNIDKDDAIGVTKIILNKNDYYYNNDIYINKIILKLFEDKSHFLKHKNSINIFNDKNNIIGDSIPRLKSFNYTLPQFVGLFLNNDNIESKDLRTIILNKINRQDIIKDLGESNIKEIKNPFLTEIEIDNKESELNLDTKLADLGYFSKQNIINKIITIDKNKKTYSREIKIKKNLKIKQEEVSFIISPSSVKKYNFVTKDNILLKGDINDKDIEYIYINDYKLKGFKKGNSVFYYRLKEESYETIKQGKNIYNIYSEKNGKKTFIGDIFFFYYKDTDKLEKIKNSMFAKNDDNKVKKETTSSGGLVHFDNINKNKLEGLKKEFYYNKELEVFNLNIVYINSDNNIKKTAEKIKEILENNKIQVNLQPLSMSNLTESIRKGELNYDILIIGINLGYFNFNLFPYLHSSQVKSGYNFSNFKKLSLDILLEELKSNKLSNTKIIELEKKILEILKDEQILKTLYSPILKVLVDKNIENYNLESYIPDNTFRYNPLIKSYLLKKKLINFENKSIVNFIKFIFNSLF